MDFQELLKTPYEGTLSYAAGTTVGEVIEHLLQGLHRNSRKVQDLQVALRVAEEERAQGLLREEELKKQIDSTKILDLLTRSSLVAKLQISDDSELGQVLQKALSASLRSLTGLD